MENNKNLEITYGVFCPNDHKTPVDTFVIRDGHKPVAQYCPAHQPEPESNGTVKTKAWHYAIIRRISP